MTHFFKKRGVIFGIIFLFSLIGFMIPSYLLYYNIKVLVAEELGRNAENVAVSAAEIVEMDPANYKAVSDPMSGLTPDENYYQNMLSVFREIQSTTGAEFVFTEMYVSDSTIEYVLSGADNVSDAMASLYAANEMTDAELSVFQTRIPTYTKIVDYTEWGKSISGFAPIIDDATGELLGIVGVDFSIQYVSSILLSVKIVLLLGLFFLVTISTLLLYKLFDIRNEALSKDYTTRLFNKRYAEAKLRRQIRDAKTKGTPLSLMFIDVDSFKEINDRYGHAVGDKVLRAVSEILLYDTRNVDICSRYGGDEFLIILPSTLPEEAALIAEKIMKDIMKYEIEGITALVLSASVGIAKWHHQSLEDFISDADSAMYQSKYSGKNRLTITS